MLLSKGNTDNIINTLTAYYQIKLLLSPISLSGKPITDPQRRSALDNLYV